MNKYDTDSRTVKIKPIKWMADVREGVLEHSEKRMPKWKFRIASDLIIQIQPKPVVLLGQRLIEAGHKQHILKFDGRGVAAENATADLFERLNGPVWWSITFEITALNPDEWIITRKSGRWTRIAGEDGYWKLWARVTQIFGGEFFEELTEEKLLFRNCFCCGKGLTDPASMARGIGPECASTSSVRVPFVIGRAQ